MGNCVGTILDEETIYSFSYAISFSWIEGVEAEVVVVALCGSFE
jgi:hypothetical protein